VNLYSLEKGAHAVKRNVDARDVDVFAVYVFLYFPFYCLIVLFGLTTTKLNKLYYYYYYYYYY